MNYISSLGSFSKSCFLKLALLNGKGSLGNVIIAWPRAIIPLSSAYSILISDFQISKYTSFYVLCFITSMAGLKRKNKSQNPRSNWGISTNWKQLRLFYQLKTIFVKQNLEERQALQLYLEETMDTMWWVFIGSDYLTFL